MHTFLLFSAAFLACTVEMVEALTIVLAVAVTRGWRSAAAALRPHWRRWPRSSPPWGPRSRNCRSTRCGSSWGRCS